MKKHKQEKNDCGISSPFIVFGVVSIIYLVCWIILDNLSLSEKYTDCLNCNPDVLSQFSHPAFLGLFLAGIFLGLLFIYLILPDKKWFIKMKGGLKEK